VHRKAKAWYCCGQLLQLFARRAPARWACGRLIRSFAGRDFSCTKQTWQEQKTRGARPDREHFCRHIRTRLTHKGQCMIGTRERNIGEAAMPEWMGKVYGALAEPRLTIIPQLYRDDAKRCAL